MSDPKAPAEPEGQDLNDKGAARADSLSTEGAGVPLPEDPLRELEEAVLEAQEFILRFKELALKLYLPLTHVSFEALHRAESVLQRFEYGRPAAEELRQSVSERQKRTAIETVAQVVREIRRATLLLQAQVFRLDETLASKPRRR